MCLLKLGLVFRLSVPLLQLALLSIMITGIILTSPIAAIRRCCILRWLLLLLLFLGGDYGGVLRLQCWLLFRFLLLLWALDNLEVFDVVDLKHHAWDSVFVRLNLIFSIAATLSAEGPHIFEIHRSVGPIDFDKGSLVSHLRIGD